MSSRTSATQKTRKHNRKLALESPFDQMRMNHVVVVVLGKHVLVPTHDELLIIFVLNHCKLNLMSFVCAAGIVCQIKQAI